MDINDQLAQQFERVSRMPPPRPARPAPRVTGMGTGYNPARAIREWTAAAGGYCNPGWRKAVKDAHEQLSPGAFDAWVREQIAEAEEWARRAAVHYATAPMPPNGWAEMLPDGTWRVLAKPPPGVKYDERGVPQVGAPKWGSEAPIQEREEYAETEEGEEPGEDAP